MVLRIIALSVYLLLLTLSLVAAYWGIYSVLTTILVYIGLMLVSYKVLGLLAKNNKASIWYNIKWMSVILWCCLLLAELFLRFGLKAHLYYAEQNGNLFFSSPYKQAPTRNSKWHTLQLVGKGTLVHTPLSTKKRQKAEFDYETFYNEVGLREKSLSNFKDTASFIVAGIGDSFTEGVGTPTDSTWPALLQAKFGNNISTINAGCSGSDVFFFGNMIDYLAQEVPLDMVIVSINSSDIDDYILRGGRERFVGDGLQFRKGPWWEPIYATSYLFRSIRVILIGNNYLFMEPDVLQQEKNKAVNDICGFIENDLYPAADSRNIRLVVLFHPVRHEITEGQSPYQSCIEQLKNNNRFTVIDLTTALQARIPPTGIDDYYWPLDGHFTPKGYSVMTEALADSLHSEGVFQSPRP